MKYRKYWDYHRINSDGKEEKQCMDCKDWFIMNHDHFNSDNGNKDKYNMRCNVCQVIYQEAYYAKTRDSQIEKSKQRQRDKREELLPYWSEYYFQNKDRKRSNNQRWNEEHKEERLEYQADYRKTDSCKESMKRSSIRREIHKKHEMYNKEWISVKDYFKNENGEWACCYCGISEKDAKIKYKHNLHKDHVNNDGANDITNCASACKDCNNRKKKRDMEEWFRQQSFFTQERLDKILKWLNEDCFQFYIEKKPRKPYTRKNII